MSATTTTEGYDAWKKRKDALKAEVESGQKTGSTDLVEAKKEAHERREMVVADPELRKMMQEDAREEAQKNGSLPWLKVYVANRSTSILLDGSKPNDGWFFYGPTKEQYQEVYAHILYASRGYWAEGLPDEEGKVKVGYHNIVAGLMMNDEPKPFFLDITGKARLGKFWEFRKVLRDWNNQGFPSFSMITKMVTQSIPAEVKGRSPATVVDFRIEKDEQGLYPYMNMTAPEYRSLKEKVPEMEAYVQAWITSKEVEKPIRDNVEPKPIEAKGVTVEGDTVHIDPKAAVEADQVDKSRPNGDEEVSVDDLPF